jgi:hypothetical protein
MSAKVEAQAHQQMRRGGRRHGDITFENRLYCGSEYYF